MPLNIAATPLNNAQGGFLIPGLDYLERWRRKFGDVFSLSPKSFLRQMLVLGYPPNWWICRQPFVCEEWQFASQIHPFGGYADTHRHVTLRYKLEQPHRWMAAGLCPRRPWECFSENAMKKLVILALLLASSFAFAHSGGTDKDGCHNDRKAGTRHCH